MKYIKKIYYWLGDFWHNLFHKTKRETASDGWWRSHGPYYFPNIKPSEDDKKEHFAVYVDKGELILYMIDGVVVYDKYNKEKK